ncbi:23S rRNA (adenine(2503)-C(2))-methyltransferase RlmN [bacterium]|nr:23S rRNA (adenine(2503)-C(2))-methyltransferase RlmN [bacterium]
MTNRTPDLKGMLLSELEELVSELGQPRYRADQMAGWLFTKGIQDISEMKNLSKAFKESLASRASVTRSKVVRAKRSAIDDTEKLLLEYTDGARIEAVILTDDERHTGCISTQVGCRFKCRFCATGAMGFKRNLSPGEIVEQVLRLQKRLDPVRLNNLVFMGMGEPLDNYDALLKTIRIANAPWGLSIGARRMTVSTAGIVPGIRRLADEGLQINLAVSLNAPTQELRAHLMPIARKYPLDELMGALKHYAQTVGRLVTIEYVLMKGVNDSPEMATMLGRLASGMLAKINVICYNEVKGARYKAPDNETFTSFITSLRRQCPTVVRRISRGSDIAAGCGQLCVLPDTK